MYSSAFFYGLLFSFFTFVCAPLRPVSRWCHKRNVSNPILGEKRSSLASLLSLLVRYFSSLLFCAGVFLSNPRPLCFVYTHTYTLHTHSNEFWGEKKKKVRDIKSVGGPAVSNVLFVVRFLFFSFVIFFDWLNMSHFFYI